MVGILVIIPVVIVAVVAAVSVFVSVRAYIAVEEVTLSESSIEVGMTTDIVDLNDYLSITVLPEKANDKTLEWEIEDLVCLDNEYAENYEQGFVTEPAAVVVDENAGKIAINTYCHFYVKVSADGVSDRCFVYVVDNEVRKVSIKAKTNLIVGESALAEAVYTPIESVVDNSRWYSDDESVVKIDGNGVISAVGVGTATISHHVDTASGHVSGSVEITVASGATKFGKSFYSHVSEIPFASLGLEENDISALENCTIVDGKIVVNSGANARFTVGEEIVSIFTCAENDIEIENAKIFGYDASADDSFTLTTGATLYLKAKYSSVFAVGAPSVNWSSDDEKVAKVDENGVVTTIGKGYATLTATSPDGTASILIRVEDKVSVLAIDRSNRSFEVGIGRETVFASEKYVKPYDFGDYTTTNNSFAINFLHPIAPEDPTDAKEFYSAFNFEVYENGEITDKAYFVDNVLFFNKDKIAYEENVLTVVVSAKYPKYNTADFTTHTFDVKVTSGIAARSWAELKKASNEQRAISFEDDIIFMDDRNGKYENWRDVGIFAYKDIYGNGKSYSAEFQQVGKNDELILIVESNVTVSNLIVRPNSTQEEITSADGTKGLQGRGINIYQLGSGNSNHHENIKIEYCIIENCSMAIVCDNADALVNGSIIRNCCLTGIYAGTEADETGVCYTRLTLRNCVMSNLVGTGTTIYYGNYSNGSNEYNTPEMAAKHVAEGKNSSITQEGFLDMYNWQPLEALELLSDFDNAMFTVINTYAREHLLGNKSFMDTWSVSHERVPYFHLGFISAGVGEDSYLEYTMEDERIQMVKSNTILNLPIHLDALLFSYGQTYGDISPSSTYKVNNKLIARLHGNY